MPKYIKIIFFKKIIFEISASKQFKTYKKKFIFNNFFLISQEYSANRVTKHLLSMSSNSDAPSQSENYFRKCHNGT
jgi:hypothetical protein